MFSVEQTGCGLKSDPVSEASEETLCDSDNSSSGELFQQLKENPEDLLQLAPVSGDPIVPLTGHPHTLIHTVVLYHLVVSVSPEVGSLVEYQKILGPEADLRQTSVLVDQAASCGSLLPYGPFWLRQGWLTTYSFTVISAQKTVCVCGLCSCRLCGAVVQPSIKP